MPGPPGPPRKSKGGRGCLLVLIGVPVLLIVLALVGWFVVVPMISPNGDYEEPPDACTVLSEQGVSTVLSEPAQDDREISGDFDSTCAWSSGEATLDVTTKLYTRQGLDGGEAVASEYYVGFSTGEPVELDGVDGEAVVRSTPAPQGQGSYGVVVRISNVIATASYTGAELSDEQLAELTQALAEGLDAQRAG